MNLNNEQKYYHDNLTEIGGASLKNNKRNKNINFLRIGLIIIVTFLGTLAFLSTSINRDDQQNEDWTKSEFIEEVASHAVVLQESHGIVPSVTIAQAIVESNWGNSGLSQQENNYFGIKGKSDSREYATFEYEGEWKEIHASFRSYPSLKASVEDYARLIAEGTDWNPNLYQGVVEADSYEEAAYALQEAGYATDPAYPEKLIEIIELYQLDDYDN